MEFITQSARETQKLGKKIANKLISNDQWLTAKNKVIALTGDLGSGKTTFVQGFSQGFGIKKRIISPTFILMRSYELAGKRQGVKGVKGKSFYHVDLYRLETNIEKEMENFGVKDIWQDPESIMVIEWAEKAKSIIPQSAIWIKFEQISNNQRKITIKD